MTPNEFTSLEIEAKAAPRSPDCRNVSSYAWVEVLYNQHNNYNYEDSLLLSGEIELC